MKHLAGPAEAGSIQDKPPPLSAQFAVLKHLLPYLWPKNEPALRARTVVAAALILLAKLVNVSVPLFFKRAVDALSPGALHAGGSGMVGVTALVAVPISFILLYGFTRIMAQGVGELRELVFAPVEQRTIRVLGLDVFRHLHGLSLRFHLERQTGGLSRVLERGSNAVDTLVAGLLFNIVPTLLEITLVAIILWRTYQPSFALVIVGTIIAYVGLTVSITRWRVRFRREMNDRDAEASTKAVDSLLNYETVKYFGNEEHEARRFEKARRAYEKAAIRSQSTLSMLNVTQGAVMAVGLVIIMSLAARGIAAGRMTVGDFVLVNGYLLQLYTPLNMLGIIYRTLNQSLIDIEAMYRLLKVPPEIRDRPSAPALVAQGGAVTFEDVQFAYDRRRPILQGISFHVPPGKTVALVGPSGGGKSTVARLLFRFYDASEGRISIDGQNIKDVTQSSLRAVIGVVPQDTVLFNDTIYYNIAYGRPSAAREEVEQAARLAHIHHFIERLPDAYRTKVGERGLKLSGGEKQRVAIARVILKNPQILIFDEATSALDTHTEEEIQSNLREVSADRTTLVIAHRLSTVVDADEILVLDAGQIVERGRHEDLLLQDGPYAALWKRQRRAAEHDNMALAGVAE